MRLDKPTKSNIKSTNDPFCHFISDACRIYLCLHLCTLQYTYPYLTIAQMLEVIDEASNGTAFTDDREGSSGRREPSGAKNGLARLFPDSAASQKYLRDSRIA